MIQVLSRTGIWERKVGYSFLNGYDAAFLVKSPARGCGCILRTGREMLLGCSLLNITINEIKERYSSQNDVFVFFSWSL